MSVILAPGLEPIPGYRLIERLGRGGFGEVWKAEAPGGLLKAIKFVFGDLDASGGGEPADQELKSLDRIKTIRHPYILSLERYDIVDGQLLIVMELADRNLWDRFRECRAQGLAGVPKQELLRYLEEASEALDLMNTQYQLQHLDIKPQNLFLVYNHVKIADFGLVKGFEGKRGTITGGVTPVYAAPETFEGWVSRNSDQYSLAIVYQELLTGQRPFNGTTARQLLLQHLQAPPDVTPLSENDRNAVRRALEKKPDDRWPSCTEFVRALFETTQHGPRYVTPSGAIPPPALSQSGLITATPSAGVSPTDSIEAPPSTGISSSSPATQARVRAPVTATLPRFDSGVQELSLPPKVALPDEDAGILFPAVIIGLGGAAGRVLRMIKREISEKYGTHPLPNIRLIAVDTDPVALRSLAGDGPSPLAADEIFHAGLNRPSHYLRGEVVGIETWLGASTLYRLPKHPGAAELRAFGRLALLDHAAPLSRRLRAELDAVRSPSALSIADKTARLGVRSDRPRVYVIASLAGGTGGGMFLDAAYLARAVLRQVGEVDPQVSGVLMIPPCDRKAGVTPIANSFAALTELNHFCHPNVRYEARFQPKGAVESDAGLPFGRVLLQQFDSLPGTESVDPAFGQTATLIFNELLTPIGRTADRERRGFSSHRRDSVVPAQSAATYFISWPRDRLARVAARHIGQELVRRWTAKDAGRFAEVVTPILDEQWDLRGLCPDKVADAIHQKVSSQLGMPAQDRIEALIAPLLDPSRSLEKIDAGAVYSIVDQLVRLLGPPEGYLTEAPAGRIPPLFEQVGPEQAHAVDQQIADLTIQTVERPGMRIAGAEELVRQLAERAGQAKKSYEHLHESLTHEAGQTFRKLFPMIAGLDKYAFSGKKREQHVQEMIGLLRDYPKKQYQALLAKSLSDLYRGIMGAAPEYAREVHFCRERLQETLKELGGQGALDGGQKSANGPGRFLLPEGASDLDEAAERSVSALSNEQWIMFDARIQAAVTDRFHSLVNFCLTAGPRAEHLAELLVKEGQAFFLVRLPQNQAAELLVQSMEPDELTSVLAEAMQECHPALAGPKAAVESIVTIVAAPDSEAGRAVQRAAAVAAADLAYATCTAASDVVIYRELRHIDLADLPHMGPVGQEAYQQALSEGTAVPHSRLDVSWAKLRV
ncbi:MAG: protein kinase [Gemmataceae bacterium]|nr:protein kinase [Gemmataceae bacterium]